MDKHLHNQLIRLTTELRKLVSRCSTESIAGSCAAEVYTRIGIEDKRPRLSSEFKQLFFLLGLMLSTPESKNPRSLTKENWERAKRLLEEIFGVYAFMFWPTEEETPTDEWRDVCEVAMPAFLHYFNNALMASKEQIGERIGYYLAPFDEYFASSTGISASDNLQIIEWIGQSLQAQSDDLIKATEYAQKDRDRILQRARMESWTDEKLTEEARRQEASTHHVERFVGGIRDFLKVRLSAIENEFGVEKANAFWQLFVCRRGQHELTYLTDRNPAEERPLFELEPGVASCPLVNALYFAVFNTGEQRLRDSAHREAFLRTRDKALERQVKESLRQFFPPEAVFLSNVFETPNSQWEHDLIIWWNHTLFVVESKASPPVEPFRDPDRAFRRIRQAFKSDRGIQKGFNQANRLLKLAEGKQSLELYDDRGQLVCSILTSEILKTYLVCVTRDNFGILATDLSLLLEKSDDEEYPWVPNILDLQALLNGFRYFKWGPEKLCDYLDGRIKLHGKIFASDELDVAGYFIRHGDFRRLLALKADRIVLEPHYSEVFDQIYMTRYGGPQIHYSPTEPVLTDARELLGSEQPTPANITSKDVFKIRTKNRPSKAYKNKIGRGARCPCNSGKTYARCHGRGGKN
jgi:SEC-C motif